MVGVMIIIGFAWIVVRPRVRKKMECRICGDKLVNGNNRYGMVICDVCYYKMCNGDI